MIKHYVFAKRGNEKFFIFGPYLTAGQAQARLNEARGADLNLCPERFREKIKARPGATVFYPGVSDEDRPAWLGTGHRAADQADIA